jgi:protein-S-isoprenylcysteine O-methyltransferase Ste14
MTAASPPARTFWRFLVRYRVALGFLSAVIALWLAQPTRNSFIAGLVIAALGEALRVWAAGHVEKGREITSSGPYRYVRHPLYLGSALIGLGFVVAARHVVVAALVIAYLALTLTAAIRSEEAILDERFAGGYAAYRAGAAAPVARRFSLARAVGNREYRAVAGLVVGMAFLWWKAQ